MPARVKIQVNKGKLDGKQFEYTERESLVLGRQGDCAIVFPENTVSRYHCMMEITPPTVTVRDFGSLNGTFLNGDLIGQRPDGMDIDQARAQQYNEFEMKQGDRLGMGKDCEFTVDIYAPSHCAECGAEIPEGEEGLYRSDAGEALCQRCQTTLEERKEAERKRLEEKRLAEEKAQRDIEEAERIAAALRAKEQEAADQEAREKAERDREEAERIAEKIRKKQQEEEDRAAEEERRRREQREAEEREKAMRQRRACEVCGATLDNDPMEPALCTDCHQDPMRVLEFLMLQALKGEGDAKEIAGYKKIRSLGRGGMGEVWLVEEEATGQQMALKLMLSQAATSPENKQAFMREAHLAEQLMHKNVVRHFTSGNSGETFFMLIELCEGGSVDKLMEKHGGKLPIDMATEIILQVLDGLDYTHHAQVQSKLADGTMETVYGVVHRDFKPGNIFLMDTSDHPVAKVADFGLAKAFETAGMTGNTRTGTRAGTPAFMPRQQVLNFRYAKPDVDVWAAAASYYNMLSGDIPKDLMMCGDVWASALMSGSRPIKSKVPGIPNRLAEVLDEALLDKPSIGISTAAELKRQIEDAIR